MSDPDRERLKERKSVVNWLRLEADNHPTFASVLLTLALRIESGEHRTIADISEEHADTEDLDPWPA